LKLSNDKVNQTQYMFNNVFTLKLYLETEHDLSLDKILILVLNF